MVDVRSLGDGSVEPLPGGVRELVVEDGNGVVDVVALESVVADLANNGGLSAFGSTNCRGTEKRVAQR